MGPVAQSTAANEPAHKWRSSRSSKLTADLAAAKQIVQHPQYHLVQVCQSNPLWKAGANPNWVDDVAWHGRPQVVIC